LSGGITFRGFVHGNTPEIEDDPVMEKFVKTTESEEAKMGETKME
jgi:hypothetical protein